MDPQEPVRKSVRKKDSTEQQMQSNRFSVSNSFESFLSGIDSDAVINQNALNDIVTKEISRDVGGRSWDDIAGRSLAKRLIKESALWPMLRPDIFTGLRSVCRVLSFSGPGSDSKLPLAECIAAYNGSSFFMVSFTSLKTKWARQGKDLLVALFAEANRQQPSVIYVQEAEELIKYDNSDDVFTQAIKSEFRVQLQKINDEEQVLVVLTISKLDDFSEADGRLLGKAIAIALPDQEARLDILRELLLKENVDIDEEQMELISFLTDGFSESNLKETCKRAALEPVEREMNEDHTNIELELLRPIEYKDMQKAVDEMKGSLDIQEDQAFDNWMDN